MLLTWRLLCRIPESPRWLVMKDRLDDARAVLQRLHEPEEAEIEMQRAKKSYRRRSILGFGTTICIQFSGILVINSE